MTGATLQGELYSITLGPPARLARDDAPDGRSHEDFQQWLERARPALDGYFAELARGKGLPLARFDDGEHQDIAGAVSDEVPPVGGDLTDEEHFRAHHLGGPVVVRLRGSGLMPADESFELCLLVTARVQRAQVEAVLRRVAAIVAGALHQQAAPPPPPPAPSLLSRVRAWFRGSE